MNPAVSRDAVDGVAPSSGDLKALSPGKRTSIGGMMPRWGRLRTEPRDRWLGSEGGRAWRRGIA